ncbi:DUF4870 domain-containing protein [Flavobacterium daejeonense]|jgi:uncharacterized Tic20 family protein|uniref:DUF4870 domain-containing protein n=1 Tax=Flavobacterium daejeonense TaxID=350893 RepID=UPI00047AD8B4|nr:DUF4870 domain-containing protein [Flavobacterium daejeonense]KQB44039.1 Tic20 domain containing protein [Flavobacterium daejeonense]
METKNDKTIAALTHLSALSQYLIPLGNFIFPIIIWSSKKEKSELIDFHGKQIINFQLSLLVYSLICILIAVPAFSTAIFSSMDLSEIINRHEFFLNHIDWAANNIALTIGIISIVIFFIFKIIEVFLIIIAAINASNGEKYQYPLTINFIK